MTYKPLLYFLDRLADYGFESFRFAPPRVAQIDLMMFAIKGVSLALEKGMQFLDGRAFLIIRPKMHDLGTPVWGKDFFDAILKTFPETAKLVLVCKDGATIAGGLLLAFKGRFYVPSAASYRSALKYCPNHALYWEVIKKGCEKGYTEFDFGRSTIDSPTYKFKKQWVPEPRQLTWQYHLHKATELPALSPDNPKYALMINVWRRLPQAVADFLGPKVIRNFP